MLIIRYQTTIKGYKTTGKGVGRLSLGPWYPLNSNSCFFTAFLLNFARFVAVGQARLLRISLKSDNRLILCKYTRSFSMTVVVRNSTLTTLEEYIPQKIVWYRLNAVNKFFSMKLMSLSLSRVELWNITLVPSYKYCLRPLLATLGSLSVVRLGSFYESPPSERECFNSWNHMDICHVKFREVPLFWLNVPDRLVCRNLIVRVKFIL